MPVVSVIMPVYNVARYLREGVASVLGQTLRDIELILVDDGSTDGSSAICDACAAEDGRVRVVHQSNAGVASARNAGLARAAGRYLMFCDPDDRLAPEACRLLSETLERKRVDAVVCRADFLVEDGVSEASVRRRVGDGGGFNGGRLGLVRADAAEKFFGIHVALWNKIYRMDIVRRFGLSFPPVHGHEDDAFWLMYAMVAGDVWRIPDRLYVYRMRADSITAVEAEARPCDRCDLLSAFENVVFFAECHALAAKYDWLIVRTAYNYYRLLTPFFTAAELVEVRLRLLARANPFFRTGCRIVETNGDFVHVGRTGNCTDALAVRWHAFRAWLFRGDAARRGKALARAERSRVLWRERSRPEEDGWGGLSRVSSEGWLVWAVAFLAALGYGVTFAVFYPGYDYDALARYAPMADEFAAGNWPFAFHPKYGVFMPVAAGSLVWLTGMTGEVACKVVAVAAWCLSAVPLWHFSKRAFGICAAWVAVAFLLLVPQYADYASAGMRDGVRILSYALMGYGFLHSSRALAAGLLIQVTLRMDGIAIGAAVWAAYAAVGAVRRSWRGLLWPTVAMTAGLLAGSAMVWAHTGYFLPSSSLIRLFGRWL